VRQAAVFNVEGKGEVMLFLFNDILVIAVCVVCLFVLLVCLFVCLFGCLVGCLLQCPSFFCYCLLLYLEMF
jgi:hypothetical protein